MAMAKKVAKKAAGRAKKAPVFRGIVGRWFFDGNYVGQVIERIEEYTYLCRLHGQVDTFLADLAAEMGCWKFFDSEGSAFDALDAEENAEAEGAVEIPAEEDVAPQDQGLKGPDDGNIDDGIDDE